MAKIMIVDDDPDILLATRLTLKDAGHEVIEASNGTKALALVKSTHPDLIIMDVMMDSTTEGFQLAFQLRSPDPTSEYAEFSHIPILMVTAIHSTTPLRFGPDEDYLPVDDFVDKPVDPADLVKKVEALLHPQTT
jgi:CheY-like chemotaxis protein